MHKYNGYFPDDISPEKLGQDRETILKGIIGHLGKNTYIEPPFAIDYGCNISIGDDFYSNFKSVIIPIPETNGKESDQTRCFN